MNKARCRRGGTAAIFSEFWKYTFWGLGTLTVSGFWVPLTLNQHYTLKVGNPVCNQNGGNRKCNASLDPLSIMVFFPMITVHLPLRGTRVVCMYFGCIYHCISCTRKRQAMQSPQRLQLPSHWFSQDSVIRLLHLIDLLSAIQGSKSSSYFWEPNRPLRGPFSGFCKKYLGYLAK